MSKPAALIVDGAYFSQGAQKCSKLAKDSKFNKSKESFEFLLTMIEQLCSVKLVNKYWFTAQKNIASPSHESLQFYANLGSLDFQVDIRQFKKLDCYCPNEDCKFHQTPFKRTIQAQVDGAINIQMA